MKTGKKSGEFKDFADFCERMQNETVNKKCVESLIKAGVFDEFEQTRSTLMASYEDIMDSISNSSKKSLKGQVTMFDLAFNTTEEDSNKEQLENMKYNYTVKDEYSEKELLSMEKEMLGLYISGHPLEKIREAIERESSINTLKMQEIQDREKSEQNTEINERPMYKDGQQVKIVGIINSVKKKYTKTNKLMAFVTIEDLYGQCELIVFENCYQMCASILLDENVVLVEGRLSIREDEDVKIVANRITEFSGEVQRARGNTVKIDVTNLTEEQKEKLRGAIRFFAGDRNNCKIEIQNGERIDSAGGILMNEKIYREFEEIVGNSNIKKD